MIRIKSLKNTIKSIEQTMRIHKRNKDLEELFDEKSIELNILIKG